MGEDESVFDDVISERSAQDEKWGGAAHDNTHAEKDWVALIRNHNGRALIPGEFRKQMVRVAALAIAAIESFDRKMDGG